MVQRVKSLKLKFRKITIIPLILFGLITLFITSTLMYTSLRDETKEGLQHLNTSFSQICRLSGEGDYQVYDNLLYRGDKPFDMNNHIVDTMKLNSDVDATIFWGNRRISTTIKDVHGNRAIGTIAAPEVQATVLKNGDSYFSDHVNVNNVVYFGNYIPLRNPDNRIVGMLFVGKSRDSVMVTLYRSALIICAVLLTMIAFVSILSLSYSQKIIHSLQCTKDFLGRITKGDIHTQLAQEVLDRDDEIGEMGRFSVLLQKSVTDLINTDPLTGLLNRRSCTSFLHYAIQEYKEKEVPLSIVIGDIDDFKLVNDTYGHLVGDDVLKHVSSTFMYVLTKEDVVARWGGEEFLFILQHKSKDEVIALLKEIQKRISMFVYEDNIQLHITMTFGVCEYNQNTDIEHVLKCADDKLYIGKASGKNQIISHEI